MLTRTTRGYAHRLRALSTAAPKIGHSGHLSADALRNRHDVPKAESGMTHAQKYVFDLQGFMVIKNVFDVEHTSRANAAIDAHLDRMYERTGQLRTSGLYGRESKNLAGDGSTGRMDMGGMLGWAKPHCEPFRELLCHPTVAKVLTTLLGVGYREPPP